MIVENLMMSGRVAQVIAVLTGIYLTKAILRERTDFNVDLQTVDSTHSCLSTSRFMTGIKNRGSWFVDNEILFIVFLVVQLTRFIKETVFVPPMPDTLQDLRNRMLMRTLTALSDGMQYGWTSPIGEILLSSKSPFDAKESDLMWLENIYMIGGLAGLPITVYLLDKVGRKNTMMISAVESLVAWILIASTSSMGVLYGARFLTGLAADVNFVATPVYIAEISDKNIRGRLGSIVYMMMMVGIVLIYIVGPFVSITISSLIGACVLVVQLLTFSFMPESPYYLLMRNQKEKARKSLTIFRSSLDVDEELEEIARSVEEENAQRGSLIDLFKVKSSLKAFIIMAVLNTAQHFSGISVMFMNMHLILNSAELTISINTVAIIFVTLMLIACIISGSVIDMIGRKVLLYTSSFLTAVSLLILASYFDLKDRGVDTYQYNWIPIFAVMLYAVTYKYGLGLVPIVLTAELFPTNIKAVGVTVCDAVYVIAGALSIIVFHVMQKSFGMEAPFFLFGACCILTCLFSIFVVPETKGKTLDEIQSLLKGEVLSGDDEEIMCLNDNDDSSRNNHSYGTNDYCKNI
ncbi:hypothetical protein FQA39_LY14458 [Lamprigera yunnana]|nr:hypothetical protein FQA39_LY14458 [Lamprigera yunnana]